MTLRFIRRKAGPDYHRLKTMVKRSIEQEIRNKSAVVKKQGTKNSERRSLGNSWQWGFNGQCSRGDNCSFRHEINRRGKMTQSNTSPNSFMQQNERKASRTRSPRGKCPSGRMSRWLCKDYLKGTCNNSFCDRWPSRMLVLQDQEWLSDWGKVLIRTPSG